ncbi:MAG: serine hydrolase domain-containing protein, partial [Gemmatimonadota bacterium]
YPFSLNTERRGAGPVTGDPEMKRFSLLAALVATALPLAAQNARVDSVFAQYDRKDSPGCALGVFRNAQIVYSRGYGMANLELNVPITPEHVFYVGSVSKQFTAMSIALLVRDGKLSLDDEVRRHIPELSDFGRPMTIRHLVHHMSGLREKWDLFQMAGVRDGDVITQHDVVELVRRQRELNFPSGEEHLYNNTAYDLLSTIVTRVSGKSHREFAQERIFGPLGMTHTRYVDDRYLVLPGRADAYAPRRAGGWVTANINTVETTGSGGVHSTIADLQRWDESFYSHTLGGPQLTALVQTPGTLNSGEKLSYAFGLTIDEYGGRRRVQHGGALGGYRAMLMRFPDEHFSVAMLCNAANANTGLLAERVTDVYLAKPAMVASGDGAAAVPFGEDQPVRYVGAYLNLQTDELLRVGERAGALTIAGNTPLVHEGSHRFRVNTSGLKLTFDVPHAGSAQRVRVTRASGRAVTYERVPALPANVPLGDYAGMYRSNEADAMWRVVVRDTMLTIFNTPVSAGTELTPVFADAFTTAGWLVRFHREAGGQVDRLTVTTGRSRRVVFERDRER